MWTYHARKLVYPSVLLVAASLLCYSAQAHELSVSNTGRYKVAPYITLREAIALLPAKDQKLVTPAELELSRRIFAGELKDISPTEAMLTVDGVTDEAKRQHYRDRLKEITAEARELTASAETTEEKATILAKYLYEGPCHGGPDEDQADVCRLLDTGKFNCVSSSILYNLVANRLGIKTRCERVPGHVFLRIGDLYIEPVAGFTCSAVDHRKIVDEQIMPTARADVVRCFKNKDHMYTTGNASIIGDPYQTFASQAQKNNRMDLCAIRLMQGACFDNNNPVFEYYLEFAVKKWFDTSLNDHQFAKAQKLAAIYGQLFGDKSDELFAKLATARAGKPKKG